MRNSKDSRFNRRRLSISDVTSIVVAQTLKAPIITGDADLSYVAQKVGVKVIW